MSEQPEIRSEPFNRLTRLCNDVTEFLAQHPDHMPNDQAIIVIEDEGDVGSVLFGYDHMADPVTTLLQLLGNMCKATGKKMIIELDGEQMEL